MLEIQVTIKAPELSAAVEHLAEAVAGKKPEPVTVPAEAPKAAELPKAPEAPKAAPVAPKAPAAPKAAPKPAAPTYTLDVLANAMAKLIDDGKMDQCIAAIKTHGVQAINQLPESEYPAFAEDLKKLGAEL